VSIKRLVNKCGCHKQDTKKNKRIRHFLSPCIRLWL
jgi:hypothetical protein